MGYEAIVIPLYYVSVNGAATRTRTPHLMLTRQLLYLMSYGSVILERVAGIEPVSYSLEGCLATIALPALFLFILDASTRHHHTQYFLHGWNKIVVVRPKTHSYLY